MGSLDLPDQPDKPVRAMHGDAGGADGNRHRSRDLPDPDERGRAYEAARAHVSAETPAEASVGQRPDAGDQRAYWDEVPRASGMRAEHEKDWPAKRRATVDRSGDLPGSYRSDSGYYLSPARHAETTAAIGRMRLTEPGISADVCATEQQNKYGGWLEGFGRRLKGDDRLKEKIAEKFRTQSDRGATGIIREIPDAIRYTFCLTSEAYTKGYYDIKEGLESRGYEMYESRNSWNGAEYKGINTRWVTRDGQRFEVQFHTPESFHAKEHVTHWAYVRIRNRLTSDAERADLKEFQREVGSWVKAPNGAQEIPDFNKEGF